MHDHRRLARLLARVHRCEQDQRVSVHWLAERHERSADRRPPYPEWARWNTLPGEEPWGLRISEDALLVDPEHGVLTSLSEADMLALGTKVGSRLTPRFD